MEGSYEFEVEGGLMVRLKFAVNLSELFSGSREFKNRSYETLTTHPRIIESFFRNSIWQFCKMVLAT